MSVKYNALVLDDEHEWREIYKRRLEGLNIFNQVMDMNSGEEGWFYIKNGGKVNLVVADLFMKPNYDEESMKVINPDRVFGGAWLIQKMADEYPEIPILLISNKKTAGKARNDWLRKYRNYIFVDKNKLNEDLSYKTCEAIVRLVEASSLETLVAEEIIGDSLAMREVYYLISKCASTDAPVLILGESGTGKELVAKLIHLKSSRNQSSFVVLNCGAIPETLAESVLFGHEKGAFTGAISRKQGQIELANGGTLFLDEVGEMYLPTQVKLLRVLQDGEFTRVGGNNKIKSDFRLIAATNKDLTEAIRQGQFREDLYYRLNVVPIKLPPLKERKSDIPLLVQYFIEKYSYKHRKNVSEIDEQVISSLMKYNFPGNARELENIIERGIVLCDDNTIKIQNIQFINNLGYESNSSTDWQTPTSFDEKVKAYEQSLIAEALNRCNGNVNVTAAYLDMAISTLRDKIDKHDLKHLVSPMRQKKVVPNF